MNIFGWIIIGIVVLSQAILLFFIIKTRGFSGKEQLEWQIERYKLLNELKDIKARSDAQVASELAEIRFIDGRDISFADIRAKVLWEGQRNSVGIGEQEFDESERYIPLSKLEFILNRVLMQLGKGNENGKNTGA